MNQTEMIERLLSMTREIEQAASLADWPEAARLTEARSPLLMSLSADQEPAALEMIRRIQAIDEALLADAETTQDELHIEFEAAMGRTKAAGEYQRIARL
ncbi:flagellar protein FliT [Paraburkholderia domus]|jgi:flagellar protein FliT|uniref:Flagellar protein FliT n=1 Tax=Paraburkholderia domus TaxID=2793075 RepID=A0A9N8QS18_9BURK|nr:flagellar protein FliT [Paraburkholderia domus]MBK5047605.1 flagellar protein FliT [Burkholderia sp. R-70006]MBK5062775.1 flagellar protein FliT [Burkholderia sp. R-70199]MBK5119775.1 flagellar protein FliT [Burkholderia sp. R-69980]MBK5163982.1 flagellar protein FliT [Burkholderia sp. R-70211]MBK5178802.1 flagellar protein FliT [Burkholderia sp. R-69749]MCI0148517.1 flagellar protein FliT [Paraburkholderia sediminicola]